MMKKDEFVKQELKNQLSVTGLYTVHYFRYGKNFKYIEEKHNFYELIYIDSGSAVVKNNNDCIELKQGQAYIHNPNDLHTVFTKEDFANSAIITFDCKGTEISKITKKILLLNTEQKQLLNRVVKETKQGYADELDVLYLKKMNKQKEAPFGCDQIIKNCIELILISLIRQDSENLDHNPIYLNKINSALVSNIKAFLTNKLSEADNVSLNELSFKMGFSKSFLKTKFKQETGESILQYFINQKIDKSKKLLSNGDKTVNEVSYEMGFSSVQYFCRLFKMKTGMTPSQYTNSIKADNLL